VRGVAGRFGRWKVAARSMTGNSAPHTKGWLRAAFG
jgi:hypothetical protein